MEQARWEKARRHIYRQSFKRLLRRGVDADQAGRMAEEVAERSLKRLETPDYNTQREFSGVVNYVCSRLSEGLSYYALIGEMPFLATARIDRVVGVALRTDPPVDRYVAAGARRAIRVERLPGSTALLFAGLALGTLGLWYALGLGIVIATLGEIYAQALMPAVVRKAVADMWVPPVVIGAAVVAALYFGYQWVIETHPRDLLIVLAVVVLLAVTFLVPGVTLARLVGRRERKWRQALEDNLL